MDKSSQRELRTLGAACSISELMLDLAKALAGNGPALGFGEIASTSVPERIAVVIGTSGSTGKPKEVALGAPALIASARASNNFLGAKFGEVWSLLLPLTHIAAVNVLVRCLELGTTPVDLRQSHYFRKVDFTAIVPTQLFRALNGDDALLEHLRNCQKVLVGGAALPDAIRTRAIESGINVVSTYGMTETSGGCVYDGSPLEGVTAEIDSNGIIKIFGSTNASTYLNNPQEWESSNIDGWFITDDRGKFVDGKLVVEGRVDDVIVSGGKKLSLSAVEVALSAGFPQIECAAFALDDAEWGSALHLAIASNHEVDRLGISHYLAAALGDVAKPKGFLMLPSLPTFGVGKIARKALVQLALHERQS